MEQKADTDGGKVLQVHILASGSTGNAVFLQFGSTKVLVDVGISARRIERGLGELGVGASELDGILITHEHNDHIKGLDVLVRRYEIPVYARPGTWEQIPCRPRLPVQCCQSFQDGFELKGVWVEPFSISHDAVDPVGFAFCYDKKRCVLATDLGVVTPQVEAAMHNAQVLILESNHDLDMLHRGPYPPYLKRRIRSPKGHLSNQMQPMGTISETISTKQNLLLASADAGSQNASLEHQPSMKGTAISPNLTWPQSGDFGSILKLWSQIQLLLERTVIKGDTTALPIQGQLQQLLQSHPDLMQGWVLMENILKNAGSSDNQVLRDMQAIIRTLEHEISGQQILNTVGRFSAETTFPGIYLAFPLKLEQDHYTMCELRLNREGRQMSREDNSLQIAVSLDTPHMGIVLFHVLWRRAGTLDIRAVVEKDFVRDFFLKNWEELSGSLEQMGYRVNNLGIKVVDERTEIESLRPDLQMPAALKTRPISIDIII
jgi:phosphoribosyl 1,2-cyclic phosphodiesterase